MSSRAGHFRRTFGADIVADATVVCTTLAPCAIDGAQAIGLLDLAVFIVRAGVIGPRMPMLPCRQGHDFAPLRIPASAAGARLTLQSVGVSGLRGSRPAFSRAIRLAIR